MEGEDERALEVGQKGAYEARLVLERGSECLFLLQVSLTCWTKSYLGSSPTSRSFGQF